MLSATPNEGQYSGNTLNVDLGGEGGKLIYIYIYPNNGQSNGSLDYRVVYGDKGVI